VYHNAGVVVQQLDIPIVQKTYDLYRTLHDFQKTIPKMDRYTLWQKSENAALSILEGLLMVGYLQQEKRPDKLIQVSSQVDLLRVFLRLSLDVKAINQKKYIALQQALDEIGRMLGGWMKSLKQK